MCNFKHLTRNVLLCSSYNLKCIFVLCKLLTEKLISIRNRKYEYQLIFNKLFPCVPSKGKKYIGATNILIVSHTNYLEELLKIKQ